MQKGIVAKKRGRAGLINLGKYSVVLLKVIGEPLPFTGPAEQQHSRQHVGRISVDAETFEGIAQRSDGQEN